MTLDEAIKIKETYLKGDEAVDSHEHIKADMLSIEALKRVLETRVEPKYSSVNPLPGETKE